MKSRANLKGHPIHPMLIPFPIAFFTGAFIFDIVSVLNGNTRLWDVGLYLSIAGIIGGAAAAVPGLIDYFGTVPPNSSAKKRASKHALLNVTMLLLFLSAVLYRSSGGTSSAIVISLELAAIILMCFAGWMGATLVYRNQIGVDPRYADAGKWKELKTNEEAGKIEVGAIDELKTNQMKLVHIGKKRVVIAKTENGYVAFNDRCSHRGGSLAGGSMICGTVQCPWHGSQFDVKTGNVKAGPANEKIEVYAISESQGKIFVHI